uniref:Retrotransposon gag domain-containing protein n=1 Tax=Tanacetum cinerariifolium TaxID=118510 RepID=A0A6L2LFX1_TANCI|nr:hypothetical protein [Tanacetum cinerariifolium]
MTKSSTNKLFTLYKEPELEFRSSRRHFKTLSLDELRSPYFNLLSDQEYSEEEIAKIMAETMKQYMSKTRANYGSGVARPKIEKKDNFEPKGQFLKELRTNTFSGSDHEDENETLRKFLRLSIYSTFQISLLTNLKTKFLNKYCPPARTAKKMEEINNFQQEPDENLYQAWERFKELLMKCPQHYLMEMQEIILFYNGLGIPTRQILDSKGAIPSKTIADAKISIQEMAEYSHKWHNGTSKSRRALVSVMPLLTYFNLGLDKLAHTKLTIKLADRTVKYPKGIAENMLVRISKLVFLVDFIILDMPEDIKVPLILERPFLSTACAKIDVYKKKITLRVWEKKVVFISVKPASSLIKRVYMLSLRKIMELDLEARLMGETLVLNRSLDPFFKDYIKLNNLNEPIELRRNQGDDLIPTIKEGDIIEEFRTRYEDLDTGINDYPILENMDAYHDEGMGDVIVGEPLLREVGIKAKQLGETINIYKDDKSVTNQMVRLHPRFKHHINEQWSKIPPLLKVSDKDMMNGILHPYQKLKGFYKGVLNLGPDYIRDARMEEWLTYGHISVHEME